MTQTAESERYWWSDLTPEEMLKNTAGVPPYDVTEVGALVLAEMSPSYMGRILDLGCGIGRLTSWIAERVPDAEITAVDISPTMLAKAARRHNILYRLCDGRSLPEACGTFDGAYSVTVFQHIPADAVCGYITQVALHLRSSARFVFNASIGTVSTFLQHDLDEAEVVAWMKAAGLEDVKSWRQYGWTWFMGEKA